MEPPREKSKPHSIFLDADVFVASVSQKDNLHKTVENIFSRLEKQEIIYYTSNYVFAEAITVISQKIGHHIAVQFINTKKSPESTILTYWINEEIEQEAIEIFEKQSSKNVSFVDCTNMAIMKIHNMDAVFSFDAVYKRNDIPMVAEIFKR